MASGCRRPPYNRGVERPFSRDRAAALAGAVAQELNDELTLILNGIGSPLPEPERTQLVEEASLRCAALTRRLQAYAERRGGRRRPAPLDAVLDDFC